MKTFFRSQFSSLMATLVDFTVTITLKELAGVGYLAAHVSGMSSGAVTQFTINRKWTFQQQKSKLGKTLVRYIVLWFLALAVNTAGVWLLTSFAHLNYIVSKVLVSSLSSVLFSYYLQKKYVFG